MEETGLLNSVKVDELKGLVTVELNLTKDYRKAKDGISDLLYTVDWV